MAIRCCHWSWGLKPDKGDESIAGKITWIGIDAQKIFGCLDDPKCQIVKFEKFKYFGKNGLFLREFASALAKRMYDRNVRAVLHALSFEEQREAAKILRLIKNTPPVNRNLEVIAPGFTLNVDQKIAADN